MTFGERVVGVMKADVKAFEDIESDAGAMGQAVTVILLVGVASLIGNIIREGLLGGVKYLILAVLMAALWAFIVTIVGTKLMPEPTTKADFSETFRVVGFAQAPGLLYVLGIIPFLGIVINFFVWIWSLIVMVIGVRQVLDYSNTGRAVIVCLIGLVISWIIGFVVVLPLMIGRAVLGS
jgi:hypothetical protein